MACFSPLKGYRSRTPGKFGGFGIVFKRSLSNGVPMEVGCGQCIGCRLDRSREWAIRCVHEAQLYSENCFLTLTYSDEFLPADCSLDKRHFQRFMKRLRRRFDGQRIRYFYCGEYGELLHRPHYHACLFNFDFPDKVPVNDDLHRSEILESIWSFGFCSIGAVTFESAAYVARYVVKKVFGDKAAEHYEVVVEDTGEVLQLVPEYTNMSLRPGIGRGFYDEFKDDLFPSDECVVDGIVHKPPRYYEKLYAFECPEGFLEVKRKRDEFFQKHQADCTPERLRDREVVKFAQLKQLSRNLEEL